MKILELVIDSKAGKRFTSQLTNESISDVYTGVNPIGIENDHICTCKKNSKCFCDKVEIFEITEGITTVAAYSKNKVQKWGFESDTPRALARRLIQEFGLSSRV